MERKPNVLLVLGDRGEMLAAAIAAHYEGIPIAHLHGGEHSGSVDDAVRHAVTQLSTIHLTSTEEHAENVRRMLSTLPLPRGRGSRGGGSDQVHVVGAPALDVIHTLTPIPKDALCRERGLDPTLPTLLFVQHPDTTEPLSPEEQLQPSLHALEQWKGNLIIIGANADAGGVQMNALLQIFAKGRQNCAFTITIPHTEFLSWQASADLLVGNSSSGIIEAASFHLPVVNIGNRQKGRMRSGNVIDVPYDATAIGEGIEKAQSPAFRAHVVQCTNIYGDGHAAEKIVEFLAKFPLPIPHIHLPSSL